MPVCSQGLDCFKCLPRNCYFGINFDSLKTMCWPNDKIPGIWDKILYPGQTRLCPTSPTPQPDEYERNVIIWQIVAGVLFGILLVVLVYLLRDRIKSSWTHVVGWISGFQVFQNNVDNPGPDVSGQTNESSPCPPNADIEQTEPVNLTKQNVWVNVQLEAGCVGENHPL